MSCCGALICLRPARYWVGVADLGMRVPFCEEHALRWFRLKLAELIRHRGDRLLREARR